MKTIKHLLVGSLLIPAASLVAAVDLPTLAHDAADNVFSGKNFSWTSITTRPDGQTVTINGQEAAGNMAVSIQDGTTTRSLMVVNGITYVLTDSGWQKGGMGRPHNGETPPAGAPLPPPPDGAGHGGPGGHRGPGPGARSPDQPLNHIISEVTSWSADGDVLTGQFSGTLPSPRGGPRNSGDSAETSGQPASPTETGVVKLWVQGGILSKAEIASTVTFTPPSGTAVTHQHNDVTTFSAVGTTTVTIPAALQSLISSSGS